MKLLSRKEQVFLQNKCLSCRQVVWALTILMFMFSGGHSINKWSGIELHIISGFITCITFKKFTALIYCIVIWVKNGVTQHFRWFVSRRSVHFYSPRINITYRATVSREKQISIRKN